MLPTAVRRGLSDCVMERQAGCGFTVEEITWWENWTAAAKFSLRLEELWIQLISVTTCVTCLLHTELWFSLTLNGWKLYPVRQGSSCGGWREKLMGRRFIPGEWLCTLSSNCCWWLISTTRESWCWTLRPGHLCRPSPHLMHGVSAGAEVSCCCEGRGSSLTCDLSIWRKVKVWYHPYWVDFLQWSIAKQHHKRFSIVLSVKLIDTPKVVRDFAWNWEQQRNNLLHLVKRNEGVMHFYNWTKWISCSVSVLSCSTLWGLHLMNQVKYA